MVYSTSALCDAYLDRLDILDPAFRSFASIDSFSGMVVTIKCFESCGIIYKMVNQVGQGRVLVIDGGGSLRRALVDFEIASKAQENGWAGIICYGAVRHVSELTQLGIGICALGSIPVGADTTEQGEINIPVSFSSVTFLPEDWIYADKTGIILAAEPL